ncbi:hypothetical protein, partial [Malaciobacter mytili]|uniref:hypothetical protein n=1 Tax=Malaciobacter mytili TaxID=603050 RepID=UPI003A84FBA1
MVTLIVKNQFGNMEIKTISRDIILNAKKGEQFFLDNSDGLKYSISLIDNGKSLIILLETNPQIKIIFKNFVEIISNVNDTKSALCILNTKESLEKFNSLSSSLKDEEIIASFKKQLLTFSINTDIKDTIIIDDFNSLTASMQVSAASEEIKSDSSVFKNFLLSNENIKNELLSKRTRLDETPNENIQSKTNKSGNILDNDNYINPSSSDPDPSEKDNLNVKLSGASSVVEGENATYKVSLTDDDGNVVKAIEDMTVTFKYTYPSDGASGDDIVEVKTV